jgi:small-conductance mechanosensitive channel
MTRRSRDVFLVAAAISLSVAWVGPALAKGEAKPAAAEPVVLPEPLTREAVHALVARLSDAQVRELLLAQLERATVVGPAPASRDMMGTMEAEAGQLRLRLVEVLRAARELPGVLPFAGRTLVGERSLAQVVAALVLLALILGAGSLAERLVARLARERRRRLLETQGGGVWAEAGRLVARLTLDLSGLLAYALAAVALFFALWQGHVPTRQLFGSVLFAVLLVRAIGLVTRFLLAPAAPAWRLLPLDDGAARGLSRDVALAATVYAVAWGGTRVLALYGLSPDVLTLVSILLGTAVVGSLLRLVWRNRAPIAALIRGGGEGGGLRGVLAELWPVLATVYVLLILVAWLVELLSGRRMVARGAAGGSLLLAVGLPLVDMALSRLVAGLGTRAGATPSAFVAVLQRGVHIVVAAGGLAILARLWDLDLAGVAAQSLGGRVAQALIDVAVALLLGYLAWELVRTAIDWRLARERKGAGLPDVESEGPAGTPGSRIATLLPLIRLSALVAIAVTTAMIVLASLGVNIGPLLAGAGVVGLAIGFGAQTLVRDIVSGMFFLLDDAFRVGEYVDTGQVKGTIEKISIRSMQVRHHRGALHTIPFGEIKRLTNNSRDWMIMKLELRLEYGTDIDKVRRIIKKIGQDLKADPELGRDLLQPLKSQGIQAAEENAVLVKVKFMARPGDAPYVIQREAYRRILQAFEDNGIKLARRQVTVYVAGGGAEAGAAAAGAAVAAGATGETERPPA